MSPPRRGTAPAHHRSRHPRGSFTPTGQVARPVDAPPPVVVPAPSSGPTSAAPPAPATCAPAAFCRYPDHGSWMAGELSRLSTPFMSPRSHWVPHVLCRDLTAYELQACRRGIEFVTSNNPYLLRGFYEYYTAHELVVGGVLGGGRMMETSNGSDTVISQSLNLLTAGPAYLGGLLVHEMVHTRHTGEGQRGMADFLEGDAYGVEWAIVHRFGDSGRAAQIGGFREAGGVFGHLATQVATGQARFDKAMMFMTVMMDICDNGHIANSTMQAQVAGSNNHPLAGISRTQAQRLVTEFVRVGEQAGPRLNDIIAWLTPSNVLSTRHAYGM